MSEPTKLSEKEVKAVGHRHIKDTIEPVMQKAIDKIEKVAWPNHWDEEDINSGRFANLSMAAGEIFERIGQNMKREGMSEEALINGVITSIEVLIAVAKRGYDNA